MYCDLHTHTLFSDGSCTPAELVALAKELDLTIALTDHNTVAGLPDFLAEAEKQGVRVIPGIEFSTLCHGHELHLVGLFIQPEDYALLESVAEKYQRLKDEANREMVRRLNARGYAIDYAQLLRRSPGGNLNRAHIARALVEKGYMGSVQEAFQFPPYGHVRPHGRGIPRPSLPAPLRLHGGIPRRGRQGDHRLPSRESPGRRGAKNAEITKEPPDRDRVVFCISRVSSAARAGIPSDPRNQPFPSRESPGNHSPSVAGSFTCSSQYWGR